MRGLWAVLAATVRIVWTPAGVSLVPGLRTGKSSHPMSIPGLQLGGTGDPIHVGEVTLRIGGGEATPCQVTLFQVIRWAGKHRDK